MLGAVTGIDSNPLAPSMIHRNDFPAAVASLLPVATVFAGSDPIGLPALRLLAGGLGGTVRLVGVLTQPDRKHGRGLRQEPNAIKREALLLGVPVQQPEKVGPADLDWLREQGTSLVLVMAYGQILRPDFIALPAQGVLNLHASLLPAYRGASPLQAAIAEGDERSGVSLMRIVPALDAGPVHAEESVLLAADETAATLSAKVGEAGARLLGRVLPGVLAGDWPAVAQDEAAVSYCRRLEREDGELDFSAPAEVLERRVRALHPWPGSSVEWEGQRLKLGRVRAMAGPTGGAAPGTVLAANAEGVAVATGDGVFVIEQLQRPGGRLLPAGEFLHGCPIPVGAVLPSVALRPLVAPQPFPRRSKAKVEN